MISRQDEKSLLSSKCVANTYESGCRGEVELRAFCNSALRQKRQLAREGGWNKILLWNLSKANNHSGVQEEYYIRARINITLRWVWEYIQDSSNWLFLMLQWQFHLLGPSTTTVQLLGLRVNSGEGEKEEVEQEKWIFIWLK